MPSQELTDLSKNLATQNGAVTPATAPSPASTPTTPPEPTTTPTPTSEPAMISSAQGSKVVADTQKRLDTIAPPELATTEATKTETGSLSIGAPETPTTPEKPKVDVKQDFVTYLDPETGAETTLRGDAINDKAKAQLEKKGMVMSASDTSRGDLKEADTKRKQAEADVNNAISELSKTVINSKQLQESIRSIQRTYSARIQKQEAMNARREQTLNTLGVRLGSRYTGDTFGGILAEEERQGIARITEIEAQMLAAVEGAKKAAKEHNYTVFTKLTDLAEKKAEEKKQAFVDLQEAQKKAQTELEEEAKLVENQSSIIEQVQAGTTDPFEIFTALGGKVPFDSIKEMTDTLPKKDTPEQFTLGRYDIRYDNEGKIIARGMAGGGGTGDNISGATSFGISPVKVGEPIVAGLGATYKASTDEAQMLIDDILNKIPVQLRNTEKETELKKEQIRKQLASGYTYQQIVDRLSGFSLQGEKTDKSLGNALYNLSFGTDIAPGDLASMLNRGADEQAMTTIENAQLGKVKLFFAVPDEATAFVQSADRALKILKDPNLPKDFLGTWDGRQFKVERFFGKDATESQRRLLQELAGKLAILNAPTRVSIAGTAATESEMQKIQEFQADILDNPGTIETKLTTLQDEIIGFHNSARSTRGMPKVDKDQLLDNNKRIDLYRSVGDIDKGIVNANLGTNDFLSSGAWAGNEPVKADTGDNKSFFNQI
jgi:hypothetical protein